MKPKHTPTPNEYDQLTKKHSPNSNLFANCTKAFFVGGAICLLGQILGELYMNAGIERSDAMTWVSITLIFLSAFLTGLGIYDKIAKHAGAGTLVPITGFANAVASPALEFKSEGLILGLSAKLFVIAGPVITYGISASIAYGVIVFIFHLY